MEEQIVSDADLSRVRKVVAYFLSLTDGGLQGGEKKAGSFLARFSDAASCGENFGPDLLKVVDAAYCDGLRCADKFAEALTPLPEDQFWPSTAFNTKEYVDNAPYITEHNHLDAYPLARSLLTVYKNAALLAFTLGATQRLDDFVTPEGNKKDLLKSFSQTSMWAYDWGSGEAFQLKLHQEDFSNLVRQLTEYCYNGRRLPPRVPDRIPYAAINYGEEGKVWHRRDLPRILRDDNQLRYSL